MLLQPVCTSTTPFGQSHCMPGCRNTRVKLMQWCVSVLIKKMSLLIVSCKVRWYNPVPSQKLCLVRTTDNSAGDGTVFSSSRPDNLVMIIDNIFSRSKTRSLAYRKNWKLPHEYKDSKLNMEMSTSACSRILFKSFTFISATTKFRVHS